MRNRRPPLHPLRLLALVHIRPHKGRGILAEFLVARALGVKTDVRTEWDAYDLVTEDGLRIEVISSAYLQTWKQTKLSKPCFSIGARRGFKDGLFRLGNF